MSYTTIKGRERTKERRNARVMHLLLLFEPAVEVAIASLMGPLRNNRSLDRSEQPSVLCTDRFSECVTEQWHLEMQYALCMAITAG